MRVFVLCTGRCGILTFARACAHMTNFTAGHETRAGRLGAERVAYPDHHVEVDNRLAWFLGRLEAAHGKEAFYVHLRRDREATARSLDRRWYRDMSLVRTYADAILMSRERSLDVCRDLVDTVTENIEAFLRDKPLTMTVDLERAAELFPDFWKAIGAEGDLDQALAEWATFHNASAPEPGRWLRPVRRLGRALRQLPHFLRRI